MQVYFSTRIFFSLGKGHGLHRPMRALDAKIRIKAISKNNIPSCELYRFIAYHVLEGSLIEGLLN